MMERSGAKYLYNNLICSGCGVVFDSKTRNKKQRYCTQRCAGLHNVNPSRFCKGQLSWNKGKKGKESHVYGLRRSEETKRRIGLSHSQDKSVGWKGEEVNYFTLHNWIRKYGIGKKACLHCGQENGRIEWANISGKYLRSLDDWMRLCVKCHKRYDSERDIKREDIYDERGRKKAEKISSIS